jgi:hypothetical protein
MKTRLEAKEEAKLYGEADYLMGRVERNHKYKFWEIYVAGVYRGTENNIVSALKRIEEING